MRLSDPVKSKLRDLKLGEALHYVPDTKNGEPRPVHLPRSAISRRAWRGRVRRLAWHWRTVPQTNHGATLACHSSIAA